MDGQSYNGRKQTTVENDIITLSQDSITLQSGDILGTQGGIIMDGEKYQTNNIFGRISVLNGALFAAGTYKAGQLVGHLTASGKFTTFDASATTGAEIIAGVVINDITLTVDGFVSVAKGEFSKNGIKSVMASLPVAVTVTDLIVSQCFNAGIFLN
jgi:hypothetical protein